MEAQVRDQSRELLETAEAELETAGLERDRELHADAIVHAHGAMSLAARAALLPKCTIPRTQRGLVALVQRHLVDTGVVSRELVDRLATIQEPETEDGRRDARRDPRRDPRRDGDEDDAYEEGLLAEDEEGEADNAIYAAAEFVAAIRVHLEEAGIVPPLPPVEPAPQEPQGPA